MAQLFANSGDPDLQHHPDLGLHCLPITLLWGSILKWVKGMPLTGKKYLDFSFGVE